MDPPRERDPTNALVSPGTTTGVQSVSPDAHFSRRGERLAVQAVIYLVVAAVGARCAPRSPKPLTETFQTPSILAELGVNYVLDWCADDQPFHLNVPGMISVPYSIEVNDVSLFLGRNLSGPDFLQLVVDQYEQLSKDSAAGGRVMALCLHPFILNQAFRHKYVDLALEFIAAQPDVWLTTSDDIAAHFRTVAPAPHH